MRFIQTLFLLTFSSISFSQTTSDSLQQWMTGVEQQQINFKTLSVRAKLNWDDGKTEIDFVASFRVQKDSIIWASFSSAGGIEVARVILTPDTFMMMNKLGGQLLFRNFSYIQDWLYFPFTYKMIEQIIAGTKVEIPYRETNAQTENDLGVVYLESEKMLEKIWVNTQNYTIGKILLKDRMLSQEALLTFDSYNDLNGKPFSYKRSIEITRGEIKARLNLNVTRALIDEPLQMPFEITGRMKEMK